MNSRTRKWIDSEFAEEFAIPDKYSGFRMNSRKKCIHKEFVEEFVDSKWIQGKDSGVA